MQNFTPWVGEDQDLNSPTLPYVNDREFMNDSLRQKQEKVINIKKIRDNFKISDPSKLNTKLQIYCEEKSTNIRSQSMDIGQQNEYNQNIQTSQVIKQKKLMQTDILEKIDYQFNCNYPYGNLNQKTQKFQSDTKQNDHVQNYRHQQKTIKIEKQKQDQANANIEQVVKQKLDTQLQQNNPNNRYMEQKKAFFTQFFEQKKFQINPFYHQLYQNRGFQRDKMAELIYFQSELNRIVKPDHDKLAHLLTKNNNNVLKPSIKPIQIQNVKQKPIQKNFNMPDLTSQNRVLSSRERIMETHFNQKQFSKLNKFFPIKY